MRAAYMTWYKMILRNLSLLLACCSFLNATPTSLFWTNCTTDVQPEGTAHLGVDNYFTVFNRHGHGSAFPPDVGVTLGTFAWNDISMEVGVDYLGGTDDPLYFNSKVGLLEDKLFCHAPSISIGIFNAGTKTHGCNRTNQNIVDIVFGKSLPDIIGGKLYVGAFSGSKVMGKRQGVMVGYTRSFCQEKYCDQREYDKWAFSADYASGKNTIGGGGFAISYFFTPDIYIETGPVWFNSRQFNGRWKWSIQLDCNLSVFDKKA
jgi:hypothetical protein